MSVCAVWMRTFVLFLDVTFCCVACGWWLFNRFRMSPSAVLLMTFCSASRSTSWVSRSLVRFRRSAAFICIFIIHLAQRLSLLTVLILHTSPRNGELWGGLLAGQVASFVPFYYVCITQKWWVVGWFVCWSHCEFCARLLRTSCRYGDLCGDSFAAHCLCFVPSCMHQPELMSCVVIHLLLTLWVFYHPACIMQKRWVVQWFICCSRCEFCVICILHTSPRARLHEEQIRLKADSP